jgi:hypothetical protein
MTELNVKIRNRRQALFIIQAVFVVVTVFQSAILQAENTAMTLASGDLSSVGVGRQLGTVMGAWVIKLLAYFSLAVAIGLAIAVASVRLAWLLAVTSTTQRWWFWGLLILGGTLGLTAVVALLWGSAGTTLELSANTWTAVLRLSVWACAGDCLCTLVARPELVHDAS